MFACEKAAVEASDSRIIVVRRVPSFIVFTLKGLWPKEVV
jgi:hypothetical protein